MHRGIVPHPYRIVAANAGELAAMDFVFLCLDSGDDKKAVFETLASAGVPFIDVGMGIELTDGALGGILRVTTCTDQRRDHLEDRVNMAPGLGQDDYGRNIQVADLNALNATLAVIRWKKLRGFYRDLEREHNSTYTLDGSMLVNGDRA